MRAPSAGQAPAFQELRSAERCGAARIASRSHGASKPEVSRFLGIVIAMYQRDPALPHVSEVRHGVDHTLRDRFNDGAQGEIDLTPELCRVVFEPLKEVEYVRSVRLHPELRTILWPDGADFAPEFLRSSLPVSA